MYNCASMVAKKIKAFCSSWMRYSVVLKYMAAFLIPAIFAILMCCKLDNDSWGLLAEGRYIAEHGLYQNDALSIHDKPIIVSNYAFAVVFWHIYSMFGAVGIYVCMLLLNLIVCFLIYKICDLLSKHNVNLSLIIMMTVDMLLAYMGFVVTRAQMLTFVLMLGLIYCLELYIAKDKTKYLWVIPLISLIQINFHASYWWFLIAIMGAYIIDSIKSNSLHLQGYRTKPLLVTLLVLIVMGLVNPYGIRAIVSIFSFYFNGTLKNTVSELRSYSPFMTVEMAMMYLSIMGVSFLYLLGDKKAFRMRYFLMFFGFLALSLNTLKAFSQFILVMALPLALMYRRVNIRSIIDSKKIRGAICNYIGVLSLMMFVAILVYVLGNFPQTPRITLVEAVDAIDQDVGNYSKESLNIYTGYNDGGYIEYRGYKAYLDPRGDPFVTKEWRDFENGKITVDEMMRKYGFDYLIVGNEDDPFYKMEDKCDLIYQEKNEEKVFKCSGFKNN